MRRYETRIDDDRLYVEGPDGWLEVGEMALLYDLFGGREYTIEYDEREQAVPWLRTDDGRVTFDVRETLEELTFDDEFVDNLEDVSVEATNAQGHPKRTAYFADVMQDIWDSKGNIDVDE